MCDGWGLGLPQHSREAFRMLDEPGALAPAISRRMQAMAGFPNAAVHDHRGLSLYIVRAIIGSRLDASGRSLPAP